jgi:hypothetical protein
MAHNGARWADGIKPETEEANRGRMRERQRVDGMLILSVEQIGKMKECFYDGGCEVRLMCGGGFLFSTTVPHF